MNRSPYLNEQHDAVRAAVRAFAEAEVRRSPRKPTPTPSSRGKR